MSKLSVVSDDPGINDIINGLDLEIKQHREVIRSVKAQAVQLGLSIETSCFSGQIGYRIGAIHGLTLAQDRLLAHRREQRKTNI